MPDLVLDPDRDRLSRSSIDLHRASKENRPEPHISAPGGSVRSRHQTRTGALSGSARCRWCGRRRCRCRALLFRSSRGSAPAPGPLARVIVAVGFSRSWQICYMETFLFSSTSSTPIPRQQIGSPTATAEEEREAGKFAAKFLIRFRAGLTDPGYRGVRVDPGVADLTGLFATSGQAFSARRTLVPGLAFYRRNLHYSIPRALIDPLPRDLRLWFLEQLADLNAYHLSRYIRMQGRWRVGPRESQSSRATRRSVRRPTRATACRSRGSRRPRTPGAAWSSRSRAATRTSSRSCGA